MKAKEQGTTDTLNPDWSSLPCTGDSSSKFPDVQFLPWFLPHFFGSLTKGAERQRHSNVCNTVQISQVQATDHAREFERRVRSLNRLLRVRYRRPVEPATEGVEVPFLPTCKHTLYTMDAPTVAQWCQTAFTGAGSHLVTSMDYRCASLGRSAGTGVGAWGRLCCRGGFGGWCVGVGGLGLGASRADASAASASSCCVAKRSSLSLKVDSTSRPVTTSSELNPCLGTVHRGGPQTKEV